MAKRQSDPSEDADDATASSLPLAVLRERAKARRRRESREAKDWSVVDSRRQKLRTFAVCVGLLLLMGLGLYFVLTRAADPPADGMAPPAAFDSTVA
jgi:hypothetical protein